jgi:hypothetical protein
MSIIQVLSNISWPITSSGLLRCCSQKAFGTDASTSGYLGVEGNELPYGLKVEMNSGRVQAGGKERLKGKFFLSIDDKISK